MEQMPGSTTISERRTPAPPQTASPRQRTTGIAMMLTSSASNQVGAALGATAFPVIGTVGVVAVRQIVTALVLTPLVRPRMRGLRRDQWMPVLGLVVVFSVMNLSLYMAIDRIGLALAVTLEFLGPLTVAIAHSRRRIDLGCALLAGVGVVVLTAPGPSSDVVGIALGLLAATAWASYILLNRTLGRRLPGIPGSIPCPFPPPFPLPCSPTSPTSPPPWRGRWNGSAWKASLSPSASPMAPAAMSRSPPRWTCRWT